MSIVATFQKFQQQVETAVDDVLENEVAETVKDIMEEKLTSVVYSYGAGVDAMVVENVAPLQGTPTDDALSDVVNAGYGNYKQPYARQFVQATEQEAASGRALGELMNGLQRRGITG